MKELEILEKTLSQVRNEEEQPFICSICGRVSVGFGNNAQPINNGRCCDECNLIVIMSRITRLKNK